MKRAEFTKLVNAGISEINTEVCRVINLSNTFIGSYRGKKVQFQVLDVNNDGTLQVKADFRYVKRIDPKHVYNVQGVMFTDLFAELNKRYY